MAAKKKSNKGRLDLLHGKCDEPMKRSKEAAGWTCTKDCYNCFCYMGMTSSMEWEHLDPEVD